MAQSKNPTSFPKNKIKILLLEGVNQSALKEFEAAGYTHIDYHTKALPEDVLIDKIQDAHIVGLRSKTQLNGKVLRSGKKLLGVGAFCIGTNQIDLDTATELGVPVFNSPYSNTRSVAELVIAESIMLIRRIPERDSAAKAGNWLKDAKGSYELRGKTLGIVGYGHIGSQVSVLAEAMGLKVIYHDIVPKLPLGNAEPADSLDDLLQHSDIVTLHVPDTTETRGMMTAEKLQRMKKGSILLNLSRGTVVDIPALKTLLEDGHLAGAGIDVYPKEPKAKGEPFETPLQGLSNVILTPHIGGSTAEAQVNIGHDAAQKLIAWLDNGSTVGSHTVPPLNLPVQQDTHRLLHIHENKPGVLSEINNHISEMGVNIVGQYLKTNELIGYVVLDVQTDAPDQLVAVMKGVDHTIKARILY